MRPPTPSPDQAKRTSAGDLLRRLDDELARVQRQLRGTEIPLDCEGRPHRLSLHGSALVALDHDDEAELVLSVLGGTTPPCLKMLEAWTTPLDPRKSLPDQPVVAAAANTITDLAVAFRWQIVTGIRLPLNHRSPSVAVHSARLALSLLSRESTFDDARLHQLSRVLRLPTFDVGDREWTPDELEALNQVFMSDPADPSGRKSIVQWRAPTGARLDTMLRRFADLLPRDQTVTESEVHALFSTLSNSSRRIRRLAIQHRHLAEAGPRLYRRLERPMCANR